MNNVLIALPWYSHRLPQDLRMACRASRLAWNDATRISRNTGCNFPLESVQKFRLSTMYWYVKLLQPKQAISGRNNVLRWSRSRTYTTIGVNHSKCNAPIINPVIGRIHIIHLRTKYWLWYQTCFLLLTTSCVIFQHITCDHVPSTENTFSNSVSKLSNNSHITDINTAIWLAVHWMHTILHK